MSFLQNGDIFPSIEVSAVGGGVLKLPEMLAGSFGVVLIYRGEWCPFCNDQLGAFQQAHEALAEEGIKVVAFSVDEETKAKGTIDKHGLTFPVGHSADADKIAAATGAYTNDEPHCLQSTGFLLAPNGAIVNAVYSSRAIGRLVPSDVIRVVKFVKSRS